MGMGVNVTVQVCRRRGGGCGGSSGINLFAQLFPAGVAVVSLQMFDRENRARPLGSFELSTAAVAVLIGSGSCLRAVLELIAGLQAAVVRFVSVRCCCRCWCGAVLTSAMLYGAARCSAVSCHAVPPLLCKGICPPVYDLV